MELLFVVSSLHCKLSTVLLRCVNPLILLMARVPYSTSVRVETEIQGRELCNENNLR